MKKIIKKNYKMLIGFVLGMIVSGIGVYAATSIGSSQVSYDNRTSGMSATTMQGALDELYEKTDIRKYGNFVSAYAYNQTEGSSDYCITGEEDTCKRTTCYQNKTTGSCKAGDIIKYKVNDTDIITFHVMYDKGSTLTMQSQKNILYSTKWNGLNGSGSRASDGPIEVLPILENITEGWNNVNDREYTMGETIFAGNNYYTGCSGITCSENTYKWEKRTAHARMITVQEAVDLGCSSSASSCPNWMNSFLTGTSAGTPNRGYWTMSADKAGVRAMIVSAEGSVVAGGYDYIFSSNCARAVVEVSK